MQLRKSLASSCSQRRITRIPAARSCRETFLSRLVFPSIFAFQNFEFVFGTCPHFEHPCQKQPSTRTASCACTKKKSGEPTMSRGWTDHPRMPAPTKANRNRCSVVLFPRLRTARMAADRRDVTPVNSPSGRHLRRLLSMGLTTLLLEWSMPHHVLLARVPLLLANLSRCP